MIYFIPKIDKKIRANVLYKQNSFYNFILLHSHQLLLRAPQYKAHLSEKLKYLRKICPETIHHGKKEIRICSRES